MVKRYYSLFVQKWNEQKPFHNQLEEKMSGNFQKKNIEKSRITDRVLNDFVVRQAEIDLIVFEHLEGAFVQLRDWLVACCRVQNHLLLVDLEWK